VLAPRKSSRPHRIPGGDRLPIAEPGVNPRNPATAGGGASRQWRCGEWGGGAVRRSTSRRPGIPE